MGPETTENNILRFPQERVSKTSKLNSSDSNLVFLGSDNNDVEALSDSKKTQADDQKTSDTKTSDTKTSGTKTSDTKNRTHEVLSQDPYYKFIHDLLHAIESAGLPLDKSAKEQAKELYAKYQRENVIAQWQKELEDEYLESQKKKNTFDPTVYENRDSDKNSSEDESNKPNT